MRYQKVALTKRDIFFAGIEVFQKPVMINYDDSESGMNMDKNTVLTKLKSFVLWNFFIWLVIMKLSVSLMKMSFKKSVASLKHYFFIKYARTSRKFHKLSYKNGKTWNSSRNSAEISSNFTENFN